MSFHYALGVAYQGAPFHGWQYQNETVLTAQGELERGLAVVADNPISVTCAGRTDAGVSATKQVVSFSSPVERPDKAWVRGVNAHLPDALSVNWVASVSERFNARHSAVARRYCYVIYPSKVRHALFSSGYTRDPRKLDASLMHDAGQHLLGEHDFTSYRASKCQALSPMRNVQHLKVKQVGELVVVDIQANAFLHHMVRNIVGVLLDVGSGVFEAKWAGELLAKRDRTAGSVTAPPEGLYLVDVLYPDHPEIPSGPALPHFLQHLL